MPAPQANANANDDGADRLRPDGTRPVANSLRVNAPGHDALGLPIPPDAMTDEEFVATRPNVTARSRPQTQADLAQAKKKPTPPR